MAQLDFGFDSAAFIERLKKGEQTNCPCCGRYAQIYKRRIYDTLVRQFIQIYKLGGAHSYVDCTKVSVTGREFSKGKYWQLLEQQPNELDDSKKTSGHWRLTAKGVAFIKGEISIPEFAFVFDDKVIGYSTEVHTVQDALGERFNYAELMAA